MKKHFSSDFFIVKETKHKLFWILVTFILFTFLLGTFLLFGYVHINFDNFMRFEMFEIRDYSKIEKNE